ncbi:MAG: hypothetical protein ACRBG0_11310 [Lewinella sp.]|jgi:hypothetical protein|uniref:hypothetical protein n=1 Tax=Lewinella TaxID=70994 RepID=UPI00036D1CE3|nr:hypothetical protein [Lewinella cohaerens]
MFTPAHFLVRCKLPYTPPYESGTELATAQAVAVDRLLLSGAILQYAVAEEEGLWWAILPAQTEWHAREMVASLPWCEREELKIIELSFFACNETQGFSLN